MPDYQKLYFHLFGQMVDVLEQLDQQNYGNARARLIRAMGEAETAYLDDEEILSEGSQYE